MKRLALLEPGTWVNDRYVVLDVLGQGGMAVVYRVRHEQLGSLHALKVVAVPSRSVMTRLLAEGRAQARLRHRNIVGVHDVIEVDGSPGLVMEYVPGPSLDRVIQQVPLALDVIDRVGRHLLRGIGAAHEAGLVHRDLKPANVLCSLEHDGIIPKIADFGLVKDLSAQAGDTRTGSVMGTPNYMSPEQIRDAKSVDARTDLFAMGTILYELATRARAFPGDDLLDVFNRIAAGDHVPLETLRPDAPARMGAAVRAALQADRAARPASAAELLGIWAGGVEEQDLPAFTLPPDTRAWITGATLVPPTPPPATPRPSPPPATPLSAGATYRPPETVVAPASRVWVGVAGLGATGVVALACAGLGLGGGAGLLWAWGNVPDVVVQVGVGVEPAEVEPPGPAAPAPEAEPLAPPPAPEPAPLPPAPEPAVAARPAPAPGAAAPASDPPPPPPEIPAPPEAPTTGAVVVQGAVGSVILIATDGTRHSPSGALPPGVYDVAATFGSDPTPVDCPSITVPAGATVVLKCGFGFCKEAR